MTQHSLTACGGVRGVRRVIRPAVSVGVIDEDAISNVAVIADMTKLLQAKASRSSDSGGDGLGRGGRVAPSVLALR